MSSVRVTSIGDVASVRADIETIAAEWDDFVIRCNASLFVRPGLAACLARRLRSSRLVIHTVRRDGRLVAFVLPLLRGRFGSLASPPNDHTPIWAPLAEDKDVAQALARAVLAVH